MPAEELLSSDEIAALKGKAAPKGILF